MTSPSEHYVTTSHFVVECICGRAFSERTEAQARRRHDEHRHLATAFDNDRSDR